MKWLLVTIFGLVVLGGAGIAAWGLTKHEAPMPNSAAARAGTPRVRVTDLMAKANCTGAVIGTQLYSYETGRCHVGGAEVTIAAFDTLALRDQWIAAAKSYGGTFVTGDGWAAMVDKADAAPALAKALGGTVAFA